MSTPAVTDANIITFITTDPESVGFSAIRTAHPGDDSELLAAANSTTGPGSGTVAADPITAQALLDLINSDDFNTMTTAQLTTLQTIFAAQPVNMGSVPTQEKLSALFADYATSLAAIEAAYVRPAGPWEVYFGKGNVATAQLLDHARNSGSGNNF